MAEFNFEGFSSENEEFEIEEKKKSGPKTAFIGLPPGMDMAAMKKEMDNMSLEDFKASIPPELMKMMSSLTSKDFPLEDFLEENFKMAKKMLSGMSLDDLQNIVFADDQCDDCCDSEDEEEETCYTTNDIMFLNPEDFGTIKVEPDSKILESFEKFSQKFETSSQMLNEVTIHLAKALEKVTGGKNNFLQNEIIGYKVTALSDDFIRLYVELKGCHGFTMVAFHPAGEKEDFQFFIPIYGNTFYFTSDTGEVKLEDFELSFFDYEEDKEAFADPSNPMELRQDIYNESNLGMGILWTLYKEEKNIISPKEFGTIRNVRVGVNYDTDMILVGYITSNESEKAIQFKKDAEVKMDETEFPLYLKFPSKVGLVSGNMLAEKLNKIDFNNSPIMESVELCYDSSKRFYFCWGSDI